MKSKKNNSFLKVWSILQDNSGKYWFGTNGGITTYEMQIVKDRPEEEYPFRQVRKIHKYEHFTRENSDLASEQIRIIKKILMVKSG